MRELPDLPFDASDLRSRLDQRLDDEARAWLAEAEARVAGDPHSIGAIFPAIGRKTARGPLDANDSPDDVHAWTIDDAARTILLIALGDAVAQQLPDLYRFGDAAERRGLLKALPYLPIGDSAVAIPDDAVRSNDTFLIAAALGPYATRWFDDSQYEQAVLKCVFVGVPISPLDGLPERTTANGSRMLAGLVLERVSAGRAVPSEVWAVIDAFPPAAEVAAIEREADSEHDDRRQAAQNTLNDRAERAKETNR